MIIQRHNPAYRLSQSKIKELPLIAAVLLYSILPDLTKLFPPASKNNSQSN